MESILSWREGAAWYNIPAGYLLDEQREDMGTSEPKVIELSKIIDTRGNLTFIEGSKHVPFEIRRVFYLYDVPGGAARGGHAHIRLQQLIVALSGSFDAILDDGAGGRTFHLNRPYYGLYVPPMIWRELNNFSSDAVCLVLASEYYDENDYIRDYGIFKAALTSRRPDCGSK